MFGNKFEMKYVCSNYAASISIYNMGVSWSSQTYFLHVSHVRLISAWLASWLQKRKWPFDWFDHWIGVFFSFQNCKQSSRKCKYVEWTLRTHVSHDKHLHLMSQILICDSFKQINRKNQLRILNWCSVDIYLLFWLFGCYHLCDQFISALNKIVKITIECQSDVVMRANCS